MERELFFSSHDGGRGAGKSSGCGKLAFAELPVELDHDKHGKFLLSLRGTEFAGEECLFLGLTCFDETAPYCLSAISARWRLIRGRFGRRFLTGQRCLNSELGFRPILLMILNHQRQYLVLTPPFAAAKNESHIDTAYEMRVRAARLGPKSAYFVCTSSTAYSRVLQLN